jgi:hypothetical protein
MLHSGDIHGEKRKQKVATRDVVSAGVNFERESLPNTKHFVTNYYNQSVILMTEQLTIHGRSSGHSNHAR